MENRDNIREEHGIANARRVSAASVENSSIQSVLVTDGFGEILLSLSTASFPAALTPEQANMLAGQLRAASSRVQRQSAAALQSSGGA